MNFLEIDESLTSGDILNIIESNIRTASSIRHEIDKLNDIRNIVPK